MGVLEEPTNHKELGEDKALVLRKYTTTHSTSTTAIGKNVLFSLV